MVDEKKQSVAVEKTGKENSEVKREKYIQERLAASYIDDRGVHIIKDNSKKLSDETMVKVENLTKIFNLNRNYSIKDSIVKFLLRKNKEHQKEKFTALNNISLTIKRGESVGLIGLNGSGKSTLLKNISGVQAPDKGCVYLGGSVAGLIEVGAGLHPDLTGRENIYLNGAILGMSKEMIDKNYQNIVDFSGVEKFIDTEVRYYSSGMFIRLAFSVAVYSDPEIFLIDEVLAVGDAPFRKKCLDRIKGLQKEGKTLVIVSHSQNQVEEVCDRAVWLKNGVMKADGDVKTVFHLMNNDKK